MWSPESWKPVFDHILWQQAMAPGFFDWSIHAAQATRFQGATATPEQSMFNLAVGVVLLPGLLMISPQWRPFLEVDAAAVRPFDTET